MEFLKTSKRFDLLYGGIPFADIKTAIAIEENGNVLTTVYTLEDGLKITNTATKHGSAYEWVNEFENTSDMPSSIISELWDCCIALPLPHEDPLPWTAYLPAFEDVTAVYAPDGSTWEYGEFSSSPKAVSTNRYTGHLPCGTKKTYATTGGRSSEAKAPFFNIHKGGVGYICAIGWTGQWNCEIERTAESVVFKSKIEDTHFRLLPGEKIRTSSVVIMPYVGTVTQSHNQWRKLIKEHFSLIGKDERDSSAPLCASIWGGMKTKSVLERIRILKESGLPFEYIWMDAGWYGEDTKPTPDEFEGDWGSHTGDWTVSPLIHPQGLKDVTAAVHEAGMKFLLWFEPERVRRNTPIAKEHPEYFICCYEDNFLLDLGNPNAWEYCYHTVSSAIEEIGIDCYRQDFNMSPLPYWRAKDTEDRQGITEIKFINGLYKLWDCLLEKFPHLLIDNCASGGRRIDIETLRRSIPLWRSDYQCPANYPIEGVQCHNLSFPLWMPYSGTGAGREYDTYRFRSAYAPALNAGYTYSERNAFGDDPAKVEWLKQQLQEYLRVRPFLTEDFYPLTKMTDRPDVWSASQYHRPHTGDGIVLLFRREESPYETASFQLYGLDPAARYVFTDADTGEKIVLTGNMATDEGLPVIMPEKRASKIYFYSIL